MITWVTYLVTRLGLSLGVYAVPLLLGGMLSLGGAGAWLAGWTDYQTAILAVVTLAAVVYLISTNSTIGRIAAIVVVVGAAYIKGRIDEGLETYGKITAAVTEVHRQYKEVSDAEKARQEAAAVEARQRAELEKLAWDDERKKLREALKGLSKEAIDDPDASKDAFSADAIDRLNRLRFDRKPAAPRNLSSKAQSRRSPVLDATPLPETKGP